MKNKRENNRKTNYLILPELKFKPLASAAILIIIIIIIIQTI
jgi:hypothetical protein